MQCRVCGGVTRILERVSGCRKKSIGEMLKQHPYVMETDEVELYECLDCGHIQTNYLLPENFYDRYEAGCGLAQYFGDHVVLDRQFKKLRSMFESDKSVLLEIGCGTGNALKYARKYFDYCIGVEPSYVEYNLARKDFLNDEGAAFYNSYFDMGFFIDTKINAFCSFQVFEHLENLYEPMKKAYDCLCDDGVGLINVPNGLQIMEQGLYHQVNFEHINYYTPYSLSLLCRNNGFSLIDIESDESAIEINAYIRKEKKKASLNSCRESQRNKLNDALKGVSSFAIYGAGAKTLYYSALLDCQYAKYLFDSNSDKQGLYIGGVQIPVSEYRCDKAKECEAIVIFASSYSKEIIKTLRDDGYIGRIVYFDGSEIKIDEFKSFTDF